MCADSVTEGAAAVPDSSVKHAEAGEGGGLRRKSVREILDAYDRRMYEKFKEKYENGILTR